MFARALSVWKTIFLYFCFVVYVFSKLLEHVNQLILLYQTELSMVIKVQRCGPWVTGI